MKTHVWQRIAHFLLWGGLACLIFGFAGCGVGFLVVIGGSAEGEEEAAAAGVWLMVIGIVGISVSLLAIGTGAILKAVIGSPQEQGKP